ncbi:MAG: putative porin [Bacteroidota bacterium]|nr:putative porin [Bacteroidota bacterium]
MPPDSVEIRPVAIGDSLRHPPAASATVWSKDSVTLLEYHHVGEIVAHHPGLMLYHLGNYGQPAWIGLGGSLPWQSTVSVDGIVSDQLPSGVPDLYRFSTEDVDHFTVYPQYQAFWHGEAGDLLAVGLRKTEWHAPRPITRLRHTESANEYLYTDGMFTLNPSPHSNVYLALTRTSIGSSSNNNAARFANTRHESWNVRAAYRYRVSDVLTLSGATQYNDDLTLLNGGVRGEFNPQSATAPYVFEPEGAGEFSTWAFDPKAAELVNATMYTAGQHYHLELGTHLQWDTDSVQLTRVRVIIDSDVRRFRDNAGEVNPDLTLDAPQLNLTDHWTLYRGVLDHETHLGWADLELQGSFGGFQLTMGGASLDDADVIAHARGKLGLTLGPVALAGFGRLDQRFGSSTVSFGAGAEIPIGAATIWGGASYSARPRSPLEREYSGPQVMVIGDRTTDLDKFAVAEGGLRYGSAALTLDVRGFARNESRYTNISGTVFTDTVLGRSLMVIEELPGGNSHTVFGGSADVRLRLWRLHLDQQVSFLSDEQGTQWRVAPDLTYGAELYYRGGLIEGTLDLRVGARYTYLSQFQPLLYLARAGVFVTSRITHEALRSYTDMHRIDVFLFATIKQTATLHLLLHNVLDARSITTEFHPMFDRSFRLGVDWVFSD